MYAPGMNDPDGITYPLKLAAGVLAVVVLLKLLGWWVGR